MKRIAIFQVDFSLGGIQKALYNLLCCDLLAEVKVDVYLFNNNDFYDTSTLPNNVTIFYLKAFPYYYRFLPFEFIKNKKIVNLDLSVGYDVAIDFSGYSQECAVAVYQLDAEKKVVWLHNDVEEKYKEEIKYRILWFFFRGKFKYYNNYAAVSEGVAESFSKKTSIEKNKISCVPNIISAKEIIEKSIEKCQFEIDDEKYNLVSTGRLCHQKGFDLLIDIIAEVVKYRTDIKLYIIGDGPEKDKIQRLIIQKELEEYVELIGAVKNPYKYMRLMDGYILMSRYEGQGIVLSEAKILGLELFFPKRLEKYNVDMCGTENMLEELKHVQKKKKVLDQYEKYTEFSMDCYKKIFFS